jgi:hypothetical protein
MTPERWQTDSGSAGGTAGTGAGTPLRHALATLPGDVAERDGASVSPDGKVMIVSVTEQKSDVWLMENFDPSAR